MALVQRFGAWVFVTLAIAAMLTSLWMAALVAHRQFGGRASVPVAGIDGPAPEPASSVRVAGTALAIAPLGGVGGVRRLRVDFLELERASEALAGAGRAIRRGFAGTSAKVHGAGDALVRVADTISEVSRVGHERVSGMRERTQPARSAYRSRVRRFVYVHQDALWVGLGAVVATAVLLRLLSS